MEKRFERVPSSIVLLFEYSIEYFYKIIIKKKNREDIKFPLSLEKSKIPFKGKEKESKKIDESKKTRRRRWQQVG